MANEESKTLTEDEKALRRGIIGPLRAGLAPSRGTSLIEVGLNDLWKEIYHDFIEITRGTTNGSMVDVMGEYGQGKTFFCNYVREKVWGLWDKGFATSYVEVKGFESLADYVEIYRQIAKNVQLPNADRKGVSYLLEEFMKDVDSKRTLNDMLGGMNLDPDFAQKVRYFYKYKGYEEIQTIVSRWMSAETGIKAEFLHYIGEKGFAKLEENDVDDYLVGIKTLIKSMGLEGLVIFIDEAEERDPGYPESEVRPILRNAKRMHNNVSQDERFSQMIFMLAGTRDLWASYHHLDEAQRQRMQAVRRDLPRLSREDYIELAKKVIRVYDEAHDASLGVEIDDSTIEKWVDAAIAATKSRSAMTPRDFLSQQPSQRESLIGRLDEMRKQRG